MTLFEVIWGVVGLLVLLFVIAVFQSDRQNEINQHHELSWKLTNKGSDTKSLKTAKTCLHELSNSYDNIKKYANYNARSCYEDDIDIIRQNAEDIAEEKWRKKADRYFLKIEQAYDEIANYDFQNVENAYKSKNIIIKAYDDLFNWTRTCHDENKDIWKNINLWNEAKKGVSEIIEYYDHYVLWNNRSASDDSVRQQLIETLDKRIEIMRPEYQRKMKLRSMIMQKIANHGTVQRSHLLKMHFDGFVAGEITACYRGLVKEHAVIEYKQGSRYFITLSDAAAKKYYPDKKTNQHKAKETKQSLMADEAEKDETEKEETEENISDSNTIGIYSELIRYFDENGVEYIDKTTSGGSLYFFDKAEAENLKNKKYRIFFAPNGTKGTDHRPAWYIKQ